MKPKLSLTLTRENGHTSKATMGAKAELTPAMVASAEALLVFISTGVDPHATCATCGIRRDKHRVRHTFVEET